MRQLRLPLLLFFVAACGGGPSTGGDSLSSDIITDNRVPEPLPIEDVLPDQKSGVLDIVPIEEDTGPPEADYPPCIENSDCPEGWCVEGPDGNKVCTETCVETCPKDWKCELVTSLGSDVVFICMPRWLGLCRPCIDSGNCPLSDSVCRSYGEQGSFCATRCLDVADCPDSDYDCEDELCVRIESECPCDNTAIMTSAKTECSVTTDMGTCMGERTCTEEGLSECSANPAAAEVCDGIDNNCNDIVDEDTVGQACTVDNEYGSCPGTTTCEAATPGCDGPLPAPEECDGVDNNCDGTTDEGSPDMDLDMIPDCLDDDIDGDTVLNDDDNCPTTANTEQEDNDLDQLGDVCDDDDDNDTIADGDDNCPWIANLEQGDIDTDGLGDLCDDDKDGDTILNDDDNCPDIPNPEQEDLDEDGVGDVCTDDMDGDGVPNNTDNCPKVANAGQDNLDQDAFGNECDDDDDGDQDPDATDCAPLNASIHHNAVEVCNGVDDNCDGTVDEEDASGCQTFYPDSDKDGYGVMSDPHCFCGPTAGFVTLPGDCDDSTVSASPVATESCDGMDNNCDGVADEMGALGCTNHYADQDKDGYGVAGTEACLCAPTASNPTKLAGDCNDNEAATYPGSTEICGGGDEDCDNQVDEENAQGCTSFYMDNDGDSWGQSTAVKCLCKAAPGWTAQGNDCNDQAPTVYPGAEEICDTLDNDCNTVADDVGATGCMPHFTDVDKDGYGNPLLSACLCTPSAAYPVNKAGDCNDTDKNAYPGATEFCGGGDEDCDGATDEQGASGCQSYFQDQDKDGYGKPGTQECLCAPSATHPSKLANDCDDDANTTYPGANEICGGGDEDCDTIVDEEDALGCLKFYKDADGDNWGNTLLFKCLCKASAPYVTEIPGDCNDGSELAYPGAKELCDLEDNDCDNDVDEGSPQGCVTYFVDLDGDGFAADIAPGNCLCGPSPPYTAQAKGDCNDSNAKVNPLSNETCDGQDNNCNSKVDEGFPDTDSNGVMDCVDLDDDGDGTPDVQDCQPTNAAIPSCAGKQCGTDGCGGSCGTCPAKGCTTPNAPCMSKQRCQTVTNAEKSVDSQWTCTGCGDLDFAGQCWGDKYVVWCADGVLTGLNCGLGGGQCIFKSDFQWYDCVYW